MQMLLACVHSYTLTILHQTPLIYALVVKLHVLLVNLQLLFVPLALIDKDICVNTIET